MAAAARSPAVDGRAARLAAWLVPFAILALTALVFAPALRGEFVSWDDDQSFVTNPHWRGLTAENARWAFVTRHLGPWQPLAWLSLQLDFELWGDGPFGPHLGNLVWHALTALAVCLVAERLLAKALPASDARARWLAAGVGALVFSIHPLRVESVAWATERRDVLSGLFVALTVLAWMRAVEHRGRARSMGLALAAAAYALALASKATAMPLPFALLVLDLWPLRRARASGGSASLGALVVEKLPLFALSAVAGVIALGGQAEVGAFVDASALGALARTKIACFGIELYASRTLWPAPLWPHYALPPDLDLTGSRFLVPLLVVPATLVALWLARRRAPALAATAATALLFVLPVSGLVQVGRQLAADRYTYLPGVAFGVLAGGLWLFALQRARTLAVALAVLVLAALAWRTHEQIAIWRDSETLWRHVLAHEPESVPGRNNLANLLAERGDDRAALVHYREAARLAPAEPRIRLNLARALAREGLAEEAAFEAERARALAPSSAGAWLLAGTLRLRAGDAEGALVLLAEARRLAPGLLAPRVRLAEALAAAGREAEARAELALAVERLDAGAAAPRRAIESLARVARELGLEALAARAAALAARRVDERRAAVPGAGEEEW